MTDTAPTDTDPTENGTRKMPSEHRPTPPAKKRRPLLKLSAALLSVLILAVCFLGWLAGTEAGLRFGLYQIPSWFGVNISSQNLKGTLLDGFDGDNWSIETEGADLKISRFRFAWKPSELMRRSLHITEISAGDIAIVTKPTPPKEERPPLSLPDSIDLPAAVYLDRFETGKISMGKAFDKQTVYLERLDASYRYDRKGHRLDLKAADTPWSSSSGSASVGLKKPFALDTAIYTKGGLEGKTIHSTARLSGSLKDVRAELAIDGGNIRLSGKSVIHPFAESLDKTLEEVLVKGFNINPAAFVPSLPDAGLNFDLTAIPSFSDGIALEGSLDLENTKAGFADRNGIPVRQVLGGFVIRQDGTVHIGNTSAALLGRGGIRLSGKIDTEKDILDLNIGINSVGAEDVLQTAFKGRLDGSIGIGGTTASPKISWQLGIGTARTDGSLAIASDPANGQRKLVLDTVNIAAGQGSLTAQGYLELFKDRLLKLDIRSRAFDPSRINPQLPAGNINGSINLAGELAKEKFTGKMRFLPGTFNGVPIAGSADIVYESRHLPRAAVDLRLGRNIIKTDGGFGKKGDRLNLNITAPDLSRFGFGLAGSLNVRGHLSGDLDGGIRTFETDLSGAARNLHIGKAADIRSLDFTLKGSPDTSRPIRADIKGSRLSLSGGAAVVDTADLMLDGTGVQHRIRTHAAMTLDGKPFKFDLDASGGINRELTLWKGSIGILDIGGAFNLKLQNRMTLEAGAERVAASAANWQAMGGSLNLQHFSWDRKTGISAKGGARGLHIAELHNFFKPPFEHNLVLNGDWDVAYGRNARGYLNINRQSGDAVLPGGQALGLNAFSLKTRFQNDRIGILLDGGARFGRINADLDIGNAFGGNMANAPLGGRITASLPDLGALKPFLPAAAQNITGSLNAAVTLGGSIADPHLGGSINGDKLYYRNQTQGIILDNGSLRSHIAGRKWVIDSLKFRHEGTAELSGTVGMENSGPDVDIGAVFDKYRILSRPNRRLTVSGNTRLRYSPQKGISVTGMIKTDQGLFGSQKSSMPSVGDDVVVLGEVKKEAAAPLPVNMNLTLDLNDGIRFAGYGADVTIGGKLTLTAQSGGSVRGVGTVRVIKGRYKAYGQDLDITKGTVSFVGPLNDPNLNIRAERRLSPVGAGVEILGSLNSPRITLTANEPMSEKDKLSWLILNRAGSGSSGDNAALSAAAGALLAGQINDRIGLVDDLGFTSKRSRNAQTGELNPAEQVLTVGKQLTGKLYIGYEYSISSAEQSVKLIYRLTRAIQAVARIGSRSSGGELTYTIRFDRLFGSDKKDSAGNGKGK
ncbi:translocation/assembly module TamB domain-containing protein [Neisseria meningitidis]|uniref:translocation/assembly module TamB domain-containing protein n=1 Tax=Neisseria meningitidis TaxID=487 RepID=UPI0018C948DB|nr:translocation/assembly module TamB domain-containing protein [Neisseria meningitidis]MBG9075499.1 translocation/assembly module TamB [Neisseria meningitidis]